MASEWWRKAATLPYITLQERKQTVPLEKQDLKFHKHESKPHPEWWGKVMTKHLQERRNQEAARKTVQVLLAALKECSRTRNLEKAQNFHAEAVECGHESNIYVANALINMYAKCGSMLHAREVFDGMTHPTVVSWSVLILGYADNGQGCTAVDMFTRMRTEGPEPDSVTLVAALKACISFALKDQLAECRDWAKEIQTIVVEIGCSSEVYVQSTLIDIYAKCGSMVDAREVFDGMKQPNVVSWTALILGYANNGQGYIALDMFTSMRTEGTAPNSLTLMAALKACTSLAVKEEAISRMDCKDIAKEINSMAVENGCSSHVYVQSTLVDMYAKCGNMVDAQEVFDDMKHPDVVLWNALILGYANNGRGHTAVGIFCRMRSEGPSPDSVTLMAALKSCTSLAENEGRERAKEIHNIVVENGCNLDVYLQCTLLETYAKCGSMVNAREVFDSAKNPNIVFWTVLILGYADNGQGLTALDIFIKMKSEGPAPNSITLVAALKACTSLAVTEGASRWTECREWAEAIHNIANENGYCSHVYVQNTLLDLYAKCGNMVNALEVFDCMKHPDVVSWTGLILGYADNGEGHTALEIFTRMRSEGPVPNVVTLGAALKACGSVGALEFGRTIHLEIYQENDASVAGNVVLVNCLVDFYAKCGSLEEAQSVFELHAETRNVVTWTALLAGFSSCGGTQAVFRLFEGMKNAGYQPNSVTFLCILTCCRHAGLVEKGKECFDTMSTVYGIIPTIEHCNCMIDLLGRSNRLDDTMNLLGNISCTPNTVTWMTLLGACLKWKNVEIGRLAFQSLIGLNNKDVSAYVIMGQIYRSTGMLQEQGEVMGLRNKLKGCKKIGQTCWTNEAGIVHTFIEGSRRHPQLHEIRDSWECMVPMMKQHGYTPTLPSVEEEELCGHSERLALVCALINTEPGKTIRIVKNLSVCDDCHVASAVISKLECRTIICRDSSKIHVFKDGSCSCNFWSDTFN